MKKTSKILSAFLALVMAFALSVPVFAADKTTYYLRFNAVTTAESSQISISGEGLALTERISCDGLGAGAGLGPEDEGDESSYPVFTASGPVTVTITADYTDWGDPTRTWIEEMDEYICGWDDKYYVESARVLDVSGIHESGHPNTTGKDLAYFDGSYAVRLEDGTVKENAGTLKDYYRNNNEQWVSPGYIYQGATVTLSEPGDYLINVFISSRWTGLECYAIIHIAADGSTPATPSQPSAPSAPAAAKPAPGKSVPLNDGTGEYLYTIKRGDSLSKIAAYYYGKMDVYKLIYELNRDILPNANTIKAGQTIRLPSYAAVAQGVARI